MPTLPISPAHHDALSLIVIEDAADDYELVVAQLASAFASAHCVRVDTRDALESALRHGGWSAVLCNHRPRGLSSLDALGLVRTLAPDVPFLVVSGQIGDELAAAALHAGASDYVMKDNLGRLAPALSRALEAARAQARRRDAEAALVESEARFRALAANLPGMVFQIEADAGRLTPIYASEGARRLFGVSPAELAGQPAAWLACLLPDDAQALRTRLLVATAGVTVTVDDRASALGPFAHWIELVAQAPDRTGLGEGPRYLEITARGRRTSATRVLWDGIATDLTRQKQVEDELRRSREELRELATHLERVRESERAAIARELHDDVGSTLTAAKFQLAALRGQAARTPELAAKLGQLDTLVDAAITASARIIGDLRPPILDAGIVAALEWQARSLEQRTGIRCRFDASADTIDLTPAQAMTVFRVCQEALNNVVKHAGARSVEVALSASEGELALEIRDDGRGIAAGGTTKRGHFGLRGMQERALALGGAVAVRPRDDAPGTSVVLTFPLVPAAGGPDTERSTP